jgi:DHA1 family bicyclomycin/chloramphenicol resistance-like MFS transporter
MTLSILPPLSADVPLSPATRRTIIILLGALFTVTPFSIDMYLPALPQMAEALHCTTAQVSLSLSSYFIGMALGQLFYGPVLDRYGRKRPVYFGLGLYILTSLACIDSPSVGWLIGLRFLQALGGCVAQVAALAMVRDFFPVNETARIFSMLMLILGVSPLFAPTVGSMIAVSLGWHWVFMILAVITSLILLATIFLLPQSYLPDPTVVLRPKPIIEKFYEILNQRRFSTYVMAGAFSFSGIFVYVAGSPIIFMENFHVGARQYGIIFAILSVGFIGGNQMNIIATRFFSSERIFAIALGCQVFIGLCFCIGAVAGFFNVIGTVIMLFALLSCFGFTYPNASALGLAPIKRDIGSASALLGFLQIGCGALASACVGALNVHTVAPIIGILTTMAGIGLCILIIFWRPLPLQAVS